MKSENDDVHQLSRVVRGNGVFSAGSGLILAAGSPLLDSWLGVHAGWLIAIGVALVGYGSSLYRSSDSEQAVASMARFATAADLAWVGGAVALIAFTDTLSSHGEIALAVVTVVVLVFAIRQLVGLRRIGSKASVPSPVLTDKG